MSWSWARKGAAKLETNCLQILLLKSPMLVDKDVARAEETAKDLQYTPKSRKESWVETIVPAKWNFSIRGISSLNAGPDSSAPSGRNCRDISSREALWPLVVSCNLKVLVCIISLQFTSALEKLEENLLPKAMQGQQPIAQGPPKL